MNPLVYFALAATVTLGVYLVYLFSLDRRLRRLDKRLRACAVELEK